MSLDRLKKLLCEGLADVKNKYFKDMDDKVFNELVKLDPTYKGGDQAGNYTRWILNLYNKGKLKEEDFYKVTEYLEKFDKIKKKMKNRDIFQFKSLPDIAKTLDEFEDDEELSDRQELRRLKKQIEKTKEKIHDEADLVHDGEDWEVWIPKTFEASCALGKETSWCTASPSSPHYFNSYTEKGPLYILINKKDSEDKYKFQLHFESGQFMNRYDDAINLYELFTDNVELRNFFLPKIEEEFEAETILEGSLRLYFFLPNPTEEQTYNFIRNLDSSMHMDENGTIYYEDDIKDVLETIKGEDRRGDYLPVDFIYNILTGEGWQYFDYSPDFNSRDAKLEMKDIEGIDNLLNELGFTLDDLEEAWDGDSEAEEKLDSLGMDDIARDEIKDYYQNASRFGTEQEAVNDIKKDLSNYFPYDIDYDKGKMKIYFDMNKIEDLFKSGSYDDYEGFISSYLDYYENGGVKLNEPYYGWDGFDEEYFKSEVEALLKRLIRDKAKRDEVVESPGQQKLM